MPADRMQSALPFFLPDGRDVVVDNCEQVAPPEKKETGQLARNFGLVPFDVWPVMGDTWAARKWKWVHHLNLKGELGRDSDTASDETQIKSYPGQERLRAMQRGPGAAPEESNKALAGTSVFDPVLCEVGYRWFCPKGGSILDPFAGGATRGLVAAWLGYQYTGVEIRQGQVDANRAQVVAIKEKHDKEFAVEIAAGKWQPMPEPQWIVGNSTELDEVLPIGEEYDLCFSCPPYYNLEVYSTKDGDGSKVQTYPEFMEWYASVYRQCVNRLRDSRFLVITVGDVRDKNGIGAYYNFNADTQILFGRTFGLHTYNQAVLYTAAGSLPIRTSAAFPAGRKLGHTYQNTYVFWKGPNKSGAVRDALGELTPTDFNAVSDINTQLQEE